MQNMSRFVWEDENSITGDTTLCMVYPMIFALSYLM